MASPAIAPVPAPVVVPYLCVHDAAAAIEFYKQALGAIELGRLVLPNGKIGHAQIQVGGATIMLTDENPAFGFTSPQSLGGAPLKIYVYCDDSDALVARAVAAGAKLAQPVKDEFYGERSGNVTDPFGYTWVLSTRKEILTMAEIEQRFHEFLRQAPAAKQEAKQVREGFHTVTPYLAVPQLQELIAFIEQAFGAQGMLHGVGSEGGFHGEFRIGDSMLMIGGGTPWRGTPTPTALHLYVPDADATYAGALAAGAKSIYAPMDQPYGDREGGVQDVAGNLWFIATHKGASHIPEGMHSVTPTLFAEDVAESISFLKAALGGADETMHKGPDGAVIHASVRVGDSWVEVGKAQPNWPPMPSMFYLYVDDADAWYRRAIQGGAKSIHEPAVQPYGDRVGAVTDPYGNKWYMGTPARP